MNYLYLDYRRQLMVSFIFVEVIHAEKEKAESKFIMICNARDRLNKWIEYPHDDVR